MNADSERCVCGALVGPDDPLGEAFVEVNARMVHTDCYHYVRRERIVSAYERSCLGQQVEVYLGDDSDGDGNHRVVVRGQLLGFGQGGDFEILCEDGMVHYCWPMLNVSLTTSSGTP